MNVFLAFTLGLISLTIVKADVSHLQQNSRQHSGATFFANNGQLLRHSVNQNGDATYATHHSFNAGSSSSPQAVNNFFSPQQKSLESTVCFDSGSACVSAKFCYNGFIDQIAEHKAVRSSSGKCYAPEVCCRFAQRRSAPYSQDNSVSAAESTSEILTKEGYVVRKPSNQYLPSYPEFNPAPSNDQETIIKPSTQPPPPPPPPRTQPPVQTKPTTQRPPYQPQPSNNQPVRFEPAPVIIPIGCPAAMNCTNIEYCTQNGVISKTPVILSPQQKMFRVPMTDCRHPDTKEVGKCCRDPDYVDPWPVGRTGQYVPEELNSVFDSGAYKPESSADVAVRVKPDGYVVPQPSNNQARLYLPPSSSNRI